MLSRVQISYKSVGFRENKVQIRLTFTTNGWDTSEPKEARSMQRTNQLAPATRALYDQPQNCQQQPRSDLKACAENTFLVFYVNFCNPYVLHK